MRAYNESRLQDLLDRGVVVRAELSRTPVDRTLFDREVRSGRWVRAFPGVAMTTTAPAEEQLALAALLAAGPASAVTGLAACRAHRLRDVPSGGPVDLLVPERRRLQVPDGVRLRRSGRPLVVQQRGELRLTPVERAVADAAVRHPLLQDVRALVLAAVADRRVDLPALEAELALAPRRGSALLRRALEDVRRGAASAPEAEFLDLLLPLARRRRLDVLVNPDVLLDGRLLGRVDTLLPQRGLGFEVDSLRHHGSSADLEATLRRHERFAAAGLHLVHLTPWSVRTAPRDVEQRILASLARPSSPLSVRVQVRPTAPPLDLPPAAP